MDAVKHMIIDIRGRKAMIDANVARRYGVESKRINDAVRNNADRLPDDYMFCITADELDNLRSKISTTEISSKSRVLPKAFTEKGV